LIAYGTPARPLRQRFDDVTCEALRQWRHISPLAATDPAVRRALAEIAAKVTQRVAGLGATS
jgi:hypothetical protein